MFAVRLGTALKNLILALINATLILILLCLFVAWRFAAEVNSITDDLAQNVVSVEPFRSDVKSLTAEVSGLRSDLATVAEQGGAASGEAIERLQQKSEALETRFSGLAEKAQILSDDPGIVIDRAVGVAIEKLGAEAQDLMQCRAGNPA